MYQFLSFFIGVVIAIMVTINGTLTVAYGVFAAAVIIHVVGTVVSLFACLVSRQALRPKEKIPLWMYLGGVIGVCNTLSNSVAFGKISMTSIVALGLLGQTIAALVIDTFGLMGMERHPVRKGALLGLVLSFLGIFVMMDSSVGSAAFAVVVAFGGGITTVLSRTVNARLSLHVGSLPGSCINHAMGLPVTVLIALLAAPAELSGFFTNFVPGTWMYTGGIMGVCMVMLYNITVPRVSAFQLTMLGFVGQVFMSLAIDMMLDMQYDKVTFMGGLLVAAGVGLNMVLEQVLANREKSDK